MRLPLTHGVPAAVADKQSIASSLPCSCPQFNDFNTSLEKLPSFRYCAALAQMVENKRTGLNLKYIRRHNPMRLKFALCAHCSERVLIKHCTVHRHRPNRFVILLQCRSNNCCDQFHHSDKPVIIIIIIMPSCPNCHKCSPRAWARALSCWACPVQPWHDTPARHPCYAWFIIMGMMIIGKLTDNILDATKS